jgi:hypothetical protein
VLVWVPLQVVAQIGVQDEKVIEAIEAMGYWLLAMGYWL